MIAVSLDYYPFVLLDLGGPDRNEEDFRRMFAALHAANERALRAKSRHVLVGVAQASPSARERQLIARLSNQVPPAERACFVASVLVVPNAMLRGVLTALGWLVPGLPAFVCVETRAEAVPAAAQCLRKHSIDFNAGDMHLASRWMTRTEEELQAPAS
jgi:hypothetical protein